MNPNTLYHHADRYVAAEIDHIHARIDRLEKELSPKSEPEGGTLYDQELAAAGLTMEERATVKHCNKLLDELLGKAGMYEMQPGRPSPCRCLHCCMGRK